MSAAKFYRNPPQGWTCFHCGETFKSPGLAADHFGVDLLAEPACLIKAGHERNLVAAIRDAEKQLARYRDEDSDKDRELHAMAADHERALRRAEEAGYARGLRDGLAPVRSDAEKRMSERARLAHAPPDLP